MRNDWIEDDKGLLSQLKRGDESAWNAAASTVIPQIRRWCRQFLGSATDADDAANEVLLVLLRQIGPQSDIRDFRAWLWVVTRHVCYSLRRRGEHFREVISVDLERAMDEPARDVFRATDPTPEEQLLTEYRSNHDNEWFPDDEQWKSLGYAWRRLYAVERTVLKLSAVHGHTLAEIAVHIGTSEAEAKKLLSRSIKKLRSSVQLS